MVGRIVALDGLAAGGRAAGYVFEGEILEVPQNSNSYRGGEDET